jgi:hypothetical protein
MPFYTLPLLSSSRPPTEVVPAVCSRHSAESPVSLHHSLVRLTSLMTRVVCLVFRSIWLSLIHRYFVARCWWYLACCFDDGLPTCRDEEEANVLDLSDTGSGDNIISKISVINSDQNLLGIFSTMCHASTVTTRLAHVSIIFLLT